MESNRSSPRLRKSASERREEIVATAAQIALSEGLEQVKLHSVAAKLGVRHGLINYYFPAVEDLTIAAFERATLEERRHLFQTGKGPLARVRHLVDHVLSAEAVEPAKLWLNARHSSRSNRRLREALEEQESLDREQLSMLLKEGQDRGVFKVDDPEAASIQILVAIDGYNAYANNSETFTHPAYTNFVPSFVAWTLGVEVDVLTKDGGYD